MLYMCIHIVDFLDKFWVTYKFIFLQLCGLFDHSVDERHGNSETGKCGNTHQAGHIHHRTLTSSVMTKHFSINTNFYVKNWQC